MPRGERRLGSVSPLPWLVCVTVLGLSGCHIIFPFEVSEHVVEAGVGPDGGAVDLGAPIDGSADAADAFDAADAAVSSGWWNPAWSRRKTITIKAGTVQADLTSFVLMVDLGAQADLLARVQPQGQDLRFTLPGQANALAHELEAPDAAAKRLVTWVQLPTLASGKDTVIYVYYDNPAVSLQPAAPSPWDAGFAGVWHLSEDPASATHARDATKNGNHAVFFGAMSATSQTPGMVAGCLGFDGADDRLTAPSSASLELGKTITVSAWVNAFAWPINVGTIVSKAPNYGSANTDYLLRAGSGNLTFWVHDGVTLTFVAWGGWKTTHEWHHVAGSYDGASLRLYFDGQLVAQKPRSGPIRSSTRQLNIGSFGKADSTRTWQGQIDEVRIANVARSAAWIAAAYSNQQAPTAFYTVGVEELKPGL